MPLVPARYWHALLAGDGEAIMATGRHGRQMVPACFPVVKAPELEGMSGDEGARSLLEGMTLVEAAPEWLLDVDTIEDLERVSAKLGTRPG